MINNIENRLIKILKLVLTETLTKENINLDDNLLDFGINSVSFIKIIVEIEKEFNIEFDDSFLDFSRFTTVKDLVDCLENIAKQQTC